MKTLVFLLTLPIFKSTRLCHWECTFCSLLHSGWMLWHYSPVKGSGRMFIVDTTLLVTLTAVGLRSWESGLAFILSFSSHNIIHNMDPVSLWTIFLNSESRFSGFLKMYDRLGWLPDFVVLRKTKTKKKIILTNGNH